MLIDRIADADADESNLLRRGLLRMVSCNPTVTFAERRSRRFIELDEGCLSLPGAFVGTRRPDYAICRGQDQYGDDIEIVGTGTLARCFQHETDHLNGLVFADRLPHRARKELQDRHERVAHQFPVDWPASLPTQTS